MSRAGEPMSAQRRGNRYSEGSVSPPKRNDHADDALDIQKRSLLRKFFNILFESRRYTGINTLDILHFGI